MKWTTNTPTTDGIYWYRNLCVGNKPAKILHFQAAAEDDESLTFARFSDSSSHYDSFRYVPDKGDEWSDTPIPEPGTQDVSMRTTLNEYHSYLIDELKAVSIPSMSADDRCLILYAVLTAEAKYKASKESP